MIELANTLLPNLSDNLTWVYGIVYIVEIIFFFGLLFMPFITIFMIVKKRKHR